MIIVNMTRAEIAKLRTDAPAYDFAERRCPSHLVIVGPNYTGPADTLMLNLEEITKLERGETIIGKRFIIEPEQPTLGDAIVSIIRDPPYQPQLYPPDAIDLIAKAATHLTTKRTP